MSHSTPYSSSGLSPLEQPPIAQHPSAPPRRWIIHLAVALVALIAGAGAATSGLLLAGWTKPAEQRYGVAFFLEEEITATQKTAIQAELEKASATGGLRYESGEEAFARYKEMHKNEPGLIEKIEESGASNSLPASFRLTVEASDFDCRTMEAVGALPGVKQYSVLIEPINQIPGFAVRCSW
ncbi:permease-like cell division protein FtsX [Actinoplanes sp. NEAU-A12]|uniref:Permease-like cell division protein FtsX n=1 Tax=Actinoplanes sandaracinus TaxID=3045177 RepID=A0ABT6WUT9_9ACTN|nr:permease-like cell division protein FtsX [Actinoplanes sandaracinus]MDI6103508.1 permease-like cell division protein FtsX [Actinoplanes sandaracinus]